GNAKRVTLRQMGRVASLANTLGAASLDLVAETGNSVIGRQAKVSGLGLPDMNPDHLPPVSARSRSRTVGTVAAVAARRGNNGLTPRPTSLSLTRDKTSAAPA